MKNIEIMTCNSMYRNGECVGGYHETHKINYLQNMQHLIATIDSIIENNLLYGCEDTVLEEICVSCRDQKMEEEINKYYNGFCEKVRVQTGMI